MGYAMSGVPNTSTVTVLTKPVLRAAVFETRLDSIDFSCNQHALNMYINIIIYIIYKQYIAHVMYI